MRLSRAGMLNSPDPSSEVNPLLDEYESIRRNPGRTTQQSSLLYSESSSTSTFTLRALAIGLVLGTVICPTNIYFGLKTGHISGSPLATAFVANLIAVCFGSPLNVRENVFVVALATAVAAMPVTAGLVGVIPALDFLVGPKEGGPLEISWFRLLVWSVGVCAFGPILTI